VRLSVDRTGLVRRVTVDLVLWHFADDVLVGSKVRYLSTCQRHLTSASVRNRLGFRMPAGREWLTPG